MSVVKNEKVAHDNLKRKNRVGKAVASSHKAGKYATLLASLFLLFFRNLHIL